MASKPDPYATAEALISNAITTARVLGENPRITGLVASSIGRFAAELDAAAEPAGCGTRAVGATCTAGTGCDFLTFALAHIDEASAAVVPRLHQGLRALLAEAQRSPSS